VKKFVFNFLDVSDEIMSARAYLGTDDLAALAEAERISGTHTIEIWEGNRKVARVKKGNAALSSADRLSG
jgi:hypothetical protein